MTANSKSSREGRKKTGGRKKGVPNKATRDLKAAFQKQGAALVKALIALTKSEDENVRLKAIQACLDRGWGKPTQAVELAADEEITKIVRIIVNSPNSKP